MLENSNKFNYTAAAAVLSVDIIFSPFSATLSSGFRFVLQFRHIMRAKNSVRA